jgi:hypothetical protein
MGPTCLGKRKSALNLGADQLDMIGGHVSLS